MKFKLGKLEYTFIGISIVWGFMLLAYGLQNPEYLNTGSLGGYVTNLFFIWIGYFVLKYISNKITKRRLNKKN